MGDCSYGIGCTIADIYHLAEVGIFSGTLVCLTVVALAIFDYQNIDTRVSIYVTQIAIGVSSQIGHSWIYVGVKLVTVGFGSGVGSLLADDGNC